MIDLRDVAPVAWGLAGGPGLWLHQRRDPAYPQETRRGRDHQRAGQGLLARAGGQLATKEPDAVSRLGS